METAIIKKERYHLIDSLRGILVIAMIIYHTMFDVAVFTNNYSLLFDTGAHIFQQCICWGFILLSGMCSAIGKRHLRRGLMVLGGAAIVSFVSYTFMPSQGINFGILAFLGSAMLLMVPLDKLLEKTYAPFGFLLCFVFFLLTKNVPDGNLGFEGLVFVNLPDFLYQNYVTAYLGFPPRGFMSGDYFPLIPWIFLYVAGYFLWKHFGKKEWLQKPLTFRIPVLSFIGRHSLLIYLLHQPVCYALVYLFVVIL